MVVQREGEVALAAAHIGDFEGFVGGELFEEAVQNFDILVDLAELVLGVFFDVALGVGEAEGVEVAFGAFLRADEALFGFVMAGGGYVFLGGAVAGEGEVFACLHQQIVGGEREHAGLGEGFFQQFGEDVFAFLGGVILHDIACLVAVGEAEFELALDRDEAGVDAFQVSGGRGGFGEGKAHELVGGDGLGEISEPGGEHAVVLHGG